MAGLCPDDDLLTQMLDGGLPTATLERLHKHVDECAVCSHLIVELGHLVGPQGRTNGGSTPTETLGRYEVLDILGRGGMGTVYLAFDPELDRRVALKVLHVASDRAHERLRREARAMARLSHPNVVQVHEVGSFDGGQFVAMELVQGGTLSTWALGRPWKQVATWGAALGYQRYQLKRSAERCEQIGAEIDTLWNAERQTELRRAFVESDASFAASLSDEVPKLAGPACGTMA